MDKHVRGFKWPVPLKLWINMDNAAGVIRPDVLCKEWYEKAHHLMERFCCRFLAERMEPEEALKGIRLAKAQIEEERAANEAEGEGTT